MSKISYFGMNGYNKNPLGNYNDSLILARNIEAYYHSRDFIRVRCWVEKVDIKDSKGVPGHYAIKSNIKFAPYEE